MPLTQVFFIFRSGSVNNNWMNIYSFVEDLVKKFEKVWLLQIQVFYARQSTQMFRLSGNGAPRVRSTGSPGDVLKQKRARSCRFHWVSAAFLPPTWKTGHNCRGTVTLKGRIDEEPGKPVT